MKHLTILIFSLAVFHVGFSQTATEIVKKSEEKMRGKTSAYIEMKIETVRPKWTREMELKSWSKGEDLSLILILAPARDKGTAFLKKDKEVWNYVPTIERTIKLPPSMMSQSWMGTDLTNDDLVRESSAVTDYTHKIMKDTTIAGRPCWKILLTPKPNAAVVWSKIISYVDKKDYVQMLSFTYDERGTPINKIVSSDIKTFDGTTLAARMEFIPLNKKRQKTVMIIEDIKFNDPMEDNFFSTANMKRVK